MRESSSNPAISVLEHFCGKFDVNTTLIAPLGMKVFVYDTSENQGTWQHTTSRIFTLVKLYYTIVVTQFGCLPLELRGFQIVPVLLKMPGSSSLEELTAVIENATWVLTKMLVNPHQPDLNLHSQQ